MSCISSITVILSSVNDINDDDSGNDSCLNTGGDGDGSSVDDSGKCRGGIGNDGSGCFNDGGIGDCVDGSTSGNGIGGSVNSLVGGGGDVSSDDDHFGE